MHELFVGILFRSRMLCWMDIRTSERGKNILTREYKQGQIYAFFRDGSTRILDGSEPPETTKLFSFSNQVKVL